MSNFSTASRVLQAIRAGEEVETVRSANRVKIDQFQNNFPPLPDEEARSLGIRINVNFGEMMVLLAHARRQYLSAFMSNDYFFKVKIPLAPSEHQATWESFITEKINAPLKRSKKYFEIHRSRWNSVTAHGIGPMAWFDAEKWCPTYVAINDLRVPTDTTVDFENLNWFGVRKLWTPFELVDAVFNDSEDNHWDKVACAQVLARYKEINTVDPQSNYNWNDSPEKFAELIKQDGGYYASDAMPTIPLWHFYFIDNFEGQKRWFLVVVPDIGSAASLSQEQFLYKSDEPVADNIEHILHCQFGDLSGSSPLKYDSIRSLGFALMEPCFYTNLTRCRLLQHVHDNFNVWLRVNDPSDKARAQVQEFANMGVVRTGVSIVPQTERHQIDDGLVETTMAQLRQLMQEASSSYTQQIDNGGAKEQTAFETSVRIQQVNAMTAALLLVAFKYESYADAEIARRFCIDGSSDPDVKKFQELCMQAGIPKAWLDSSLWDVQPVSPLGMGNPALAQAQAEKLLAMRPMFDATAQQEILHEIVATTTGDSRKANRWVPLGVGRGTTDSQRDAQEIFGSLMQGAPFEPREGLSESEQLDQLYPALAAVVVGIEQSQEPAESWQIRGILNVIRYITLLIKAFAQNDANKAKAKEYGDDLGQLSNQIKALAQQSQEAKQAQTQGEGGLPPETTAKIHSQMALTAQKLHTKQLTDAQKLEQKNKAFVSQQRRDDAKTFAEIQRQNAVHDASHKAEEPATT